MEHNDTIITTGSLLSEADNDPDSLVIQETETYEHCSHPDYGKQVECDNPDAETVNLDCTEDYYPYLCRVYYHDRDEESDDMYNTGHKVVEGSEVASGERSSTPDIAVIASTGSTRVNRDQRDCIFRSEENKKLSMHGFTQLVARTIVKPSRPTHEDPIHAESVYRLSQTDNDKTELLQCVLAHMDCEPTAKCYTLT